MPLTIGLSQENQAKDVCLPEEQVKALLEDAQTLTICNKDLLLKRDLILSLEYNLLLMDSSSVMLNEQLFLKDEQIKNLEAQQDQWWVKWGYLIIGTLVGVGINEISNK